MTQDPLLTEAPDTVRDDEEEVFDLGFIVDNRDDRRDGLLADWQRLDELDTDEALETDPAGPLPEQARALEEEGVPPADYPTDARVGSVEQETDEGEFADGNFLMPDPYAPPPYDADQPADEEEDLDGEGGPEEVDMRGRARGVARGFGTSVPQDIGAGGFSVRDNPLSVPAADLDYPISTRPVSDAAVGARDVDEMGTEAELARMAGDGAALAEEEEQARRPRPSDIRPMEEPSVPGNLHQPEIGDPEGERITRPEVENPPPADRPRPEMEVPRPRNAPRPEMPPRRPGEEGRSRPNGRSAPR